MKLIFYCQHVLGMGHYMRTLEICKALAEHEVILITGGAEVNAPVPAHVREIRLPGLMMDSDFQGFFTTDPNRSVDSVMAERRSLLMDFFKREKPDHLLVELYPFGRKKFRFELDPILQSIRDGSLPRCRVVCSLRDILVEKEDVRAYENRVITTLNRCFDGLLVHADPALVRLEETFSRVNEITVPVVYTGFITSKPSARARQRIREAAGIPEDARLIVASAGGGKVGGPLLQAVADAFSFLDANTRLCIFTGPFMDPAVFQALETRAEADISAFGRQTGSENASQSPPPIRTKNRLRVASFTSDFLSWLAAADLSVSMAGYNTCMNLMAARVPALVWPFAQNREQRLRAERLTRFGGLDLLEEADLNSERLAALMKARMRDGTRPDPQIDLNGAENTARWLAEWRP